MEPENTSFRLSYVEEGRKKMKKFRIFAIFGMTTVLFLLSGCTQKVKVDATMNGTSIEIEKGQMVVLKLESNPTTGYDWEISEVDPTILRQVGDVDYEADSMLIGSGGVNTYTFEAVASGSTRLKLNYRRSWETDAPPLQTFELVVIVK
jgi:inhibitor of cysteine peptidase